MKENRSEERKSKEYLGGSLSTMRNPPHLAFCSLQLPPFKCALPEQLDLGKPGLALNWNLMVRKDWADRHRAQGCLFFSLVFKNRTKKFKPKPRSLALPCQ
jgi:hypothetical protein